MAKKKKSIKRNPKGAGRKRLEIDFKELNKLCEMQCTIAEISSWFEISEDTLNRRIQEKYDTNFAGHFVQKSGKGKISLRRAQFQKALSGNPTMQIWLGKQYLNQKDKQEIELGEETRRDFKLSYNLDD